MPRFFFHISDGEDFRDQEGSEHPDKDSAMSWAIQAARDMIIEGVRRGSVSRSERIHVADADGNVVGTVGFNDAVEITD